MVSSTNEQALEAAIEKALTGYSKEEIKDGISEPAGVYATQHNGFQQGVPADFDKQYALDLRVFWLFLESTQADELAKLKVHHANDWQRKVLERFDRLIKKHGVLHLLKKGLSVDDAYLTLMYPAPLASSSEAVKQNFTANIFSCTRQVCYSQLNPLQEIDMMLFINGIPLALKLVFLVFPYFSF